MEFSGGLGDIFTRMYADGGYRFLDDLTPRDLVTVAVISHNPFAFEIFSHHPRAAQIDLRTLEYWLPHDDAIMRVRHRLPTKIWRYPIANRPVRFYPFPGDDAVLRELDGRRFVAFAVSAGLPDRDIPTGIVDDLAKRAHARGYRPVFVGRGYDRHGRREYRPDAAQGLDLVDRLSVPGVARALQGAAGLVSCHSALSMLAWLTRKPQLLLYPQSVRERHIQRRDQWAFGVDFPECRHGLVDGPRVAELAEAFFADLESRDAAPPKEGSVTLDNLRKYR